MSSQRVRSNLAAEQQQHWMLSTASNGITKIYIAVWRRNHLSQDKLPQRQEEKRVEKIKKKKSEVYSWIFTQCHKCIAWWVPLELRVSRGWSICEVMRSSFWLGLHLDVLMKTGYKCLAWSMDVPRAPFYTPLKPGGKTQMWTEAKQAM